MKKIAVWLTFVLSLLVLPSVALAAEFRVSENEASVDVTKTEVVKNLYTAGNTINFSGVDQGDLVAAGNTLNISGQIYDSLTAAGSNVNITANVGKNARLAGSSVTVNGEVAGDLFAAGSTVSVSKDSKISGDLFVGAGVVTVDGIVSGRARISATNVVINGKIDGNLEIDASTLTVGDSAIINGNLIYRAPEEAKISSSAVLKGTTDFQKTVAKNTNYISKEKLSAVCGVFGFFGFLMGLVLLFAFVYILPKSSKKLVVESFDSFWNKVGFGFVSLVVVPIALMILACTVVGIKLAAVIGMIYFGFIAISVIAATLAIGALIMKWIEKKDYRVDWLTILVGTLATMILGAIPVIGGFAIFIFVLAIFGQLTKTALNFIKSQR